MKSKLLRYLGAATAGLMAVGVLSGTAFAESTLERAKEDGFIRVGFANEAPYAFATTAGKLTGEAPEIAKWVLAQMGIPEVDGVLTEFGSLIPGLKAGRFDLIAAGMFINPKRCRQIAFSEPTYKIAQALLVKKGNPLALNNYGDIATKEAKLAVLAGAVEKGYAEAAGVEESQILAMPDPPAMLAAVRTGRADAAGLTTLSIGNLAEKGGADVDMTEPFTMAGDKSVVGYGGFGFRQDDDEFRMEFNNHLAELIGSDEHKKLVNEFGFGHDYMLPDRKTADLCAG